MLKLCGLVPSPARGSATVPSTRKQRLTRRQQIVAEGTADLPQRLIMAVGRECGTERDLIWSPLKDFDDNSMLDNNRVITID